MSHKLKIILFVVCLSFAFPGIVNSEEKATHLVSANLTDETVSSSRPVTGIYALSFGAKNLLATYLSPLHYKGTSFGAEGNWSKAMPFNPRHAVMEFEAMINFSNLLNPAKTARMIGFEGSFSWGMAWRTYLPWKIQFTAGGAVSLKGGAYYLARNSNNPVQVNANPSIDVTASVSRAFKIGKLPILVCDKVRLPSLGMFFSPEYGETYYEIYLGNRHNLIHPGWWGNNFCIDNLFMICLDFGKTAATIGYRFNATTQWANSLNTKIFTNSLVIGVIPGGLGLKKQNVKKFSEIYTTYPTQF